MVSLLALAACSGERSAPAVVDETTIEARSVTDAQQVIDALSDAKLPLDRIRRVTAESDANKLLGRPYQYTSKIDFIDARFPEGKLDQEATNNVEVFANAEDARRRFEYIEGIVKATPIFSQYLFLQRNVLVRIDGTVTPDVAKDYEAALKDYAG